MSCSPPCRGSRISTSRRPPTEKDWSVYGCSMKSSPTLTWSVIHSPFFVWVREVVWGAITRCRCRCHHRRQRHQRRHHYMHHRFRRCPCHRRCLIVVVMSMVISGKQRRVSVKFFFFLSCFLLSSVCLFVCCGFRSLLSSFCLFRHFLSSLTFCSASHACPEITNCG